MNELPVLHKGRAVSFARSKFREAVDRDFWVGWRCWIATGGDEWVEDGPNVVKLVSSEFFTTVPKSTKAKAFKATAARFKESYVN